ncbi:MAG: sigma-54-dependent Fis family transcriptional regulator [Myxococcales bacterium]|nr:sigma-54-dependent Fis family transcriptional regulator [Myxococcales bacterium]
MGRSTLAVWGSNDALSRTARDALAQAEAWDVVLTPSADELSRHQDRLVACVVVSSGPVPDAATSVLLHKLADAIPVVFVGPDAPNTRAYAAWLPALPGPRALAAFVSALVSAGPLPQWTPIEDAEPPRSNKPWRRKTDFIIGDSRATRRLLHDIDRVSGSGATVLVTGESGTGKELVAHALHYCGPRAREPFIAVNCAAIPETLFEAELFGYQRGAFTGAATNRAGAFEAAARGTLFLDEIGEMPRALQAKLLRVLETCEIVRLGSNDARKVHARVVVATNRDLEVEVREGRFREDLFYRLHVYPLTVEPLRDRPEDIPPIAHHHISLIARREGLPTPRITGAALERMLAYSWPGNVRELVHVLNRAVLTTGGGIIDGQHVPVSASGQRAAVSRYRDAKQAFEREYYSRVLSVSGGNVTQAARLADKTRKEVYDALKRIGVDALEYRAGGDHADSESE